MYNIQNVFLNASAGSGKTFALCIRYIALLFSNVRANQILTITFTKEAANEMKERITSNLSLLYKDPARIDSKELLANRNSLILALQEYGITQDIIESNIKHIYFSFLVDNHRISTIDSFCSGVLRKFCFFIGLRSDFEIQEGRDNDGFKEFLWRAYKDNKLSSTLNFLTQELSLNVKNTRYSHGNSIEMIMNDLSKRSIEFENKEDFAYKMQKDFILKEAKQIAQEHNIDFTDSLCDVNYCKQILKNLASDLSDYILSITPESKLTNKHLIGIHTSLKGELKQIFDSTLVKTGKHNSIKTSIKASEEQMQIIQNLTDKMRVYYRIYILVLESHRLHSLHLLIDTYKACIQEYEDRQNAMSFDSVTKHMFNVTTNVLSNDDATFDSDYFYFRLDGLINHILFDEYQDTSILQYRIFYPMIHEILSGEGRDSYRSLFFVGDSKQSLYEFRGANKAVFNESKRGLVLESLRHNYRSKKNIIDFVNEKFSVIFQKDYEYQLYPNDNTDNDDNGIVSVQIFETSKDKNEKEQIKEDIHNSALKTIMELISAGVKCKDIAILAKRRETLRNFIKFTESKQLHLEFNLDKRGKLINQKSVLIIISSFKIDYYTKMLRALKDNPESGSMSKIISYKKFHQKRLNKLLAKSYFDDTYISIPSYETLSRQIKFVIEKFRLFDSDSLEFLKLSSQNPDIKDIDTLIKHIEYVESSRMREDALRAMTIHGSKGLGFLYVIVLDFDTKDNNSHVLLYDYDGICLRSIRLHDSSATCGMDAYRSDSINELIARKIELDREQNANTLYVACTRAKHGLYIFATESSSIATTLNLQNSDSRGTPPLPKSNEENPDSINMPKYIISKIKTATLKQEDFISDVDMDFATTLYVKKKQAIGLATHAFLELYMGFNANNAMDAIKSRFGFYLHDDELQKIYAKSRNFLDSKLKDKLNFNNSVIKCELSFLQKNSIYRIDAMLWHEGRLHIIEFKSTEDIDCVLLKRHTKQLTTYMEFLSNIGLDFDSKDSIKGYLVYLQDEVRIEEITIN